MKIKCREEITVVYSGKNLWCLFLRLMQITWWMASFLDRFFPLISSPNWSYANSHLPDSSARFIRQLPLGEDECLTCVSSETQRQNKPTFWTPAHASPQGSKTFLEEMLCASSHATVLLYFVNLHDIKSQLSPFHFQRVIKCIKVQRTVGVVWH